MYLNFLIELISRLHIFGLCYQPVIEFLPRTYCLFVYFNLLFNFPYLVFCLCKSKRYESPFIMLPSINIYLPSMHGVKYRTFAYSPVLYKVIA